MYVCLHMYLKYKMITISNVCVFTYVFEIQDDYYI